VCFGLGGGEVFRSHFGRGVSSCECPSCDCTARSEDY
jgi:hypothetical protein